MSVTYGCQGSVDLSGIESGGVAGDIVDDPLPIVGRQQIPPGAVAVGTFMTVGGDDIADRAVGIGIGRGAGQLSFTIGRQGDGKTCLLVSNV